MRRGALPAGAKPGEQGDQPGISRGTGQYL
jgi:hypothetical protein